MHTTRSREDIAFDEPGKGRPFLAINLVLNFGPNMRGQVETREFAIELWKRVEGLEIAEGDD